MNINATIIIQVAHFGIAYFLFRWILLKPSYEAIAADMKKKELLEDLINQDKKDIAVLHDEIDHAWKKTYLFFKENSSAQRMAFPVATHISPQISADLLSPSAHHEKQKALSDAIVSAIGVHNESH